jgi:hypothetical protein
VVRAGWKGGSARGSPEPASDDDEGSAPGSRTPVNALDKNVGERYILGEFAHSLRDQGKLWLVWSKLARSELFH